jgi:hypothetical protein
MKINKSILLNLFQFFKLDFWFWLTKSLLYRYIWYIYEALWLKLPCRTLVSYFKSIVHTSKYETNYTMIQKMSLVMLAIIWILSRSYILKTIISQHRFLAYHLGVLSAFQTEVLNDLKRKFKRKIPFFSFRAPLGPVNYNT